MSCSNVALRPRESLSPLESLIDGVLGQTFDGEDGVVAVTGVEMTR